MVDIQLLNIYHVKTVKSEEMKSSLYQIIPTFYSDSWERSHPGVLGRQPLSAYPSQHLHHFPGSLRPSTR